MKSIFIGRIACDDSILQASKVLTATNIKDVVDAAFHFTPFTVSQLNLVNARVAEPYFPACKNLGYASSFFREYTVLTYFNLILGQGSTPSFDGIYIPFSGEIYILTHDVCEFADAQEGSCNAEFADANAHATNGEQYFRRFDVAIGSNKASFIQSAKRKILGEDGKNIEVKTIESMTATADVCIKAKSENGSTEEASHEPMYFLYHGMK